jgi:hypothetical protein
MVHGDGYERSATIYYDQEGCTYIAGMKGFEAIHMILYCVSLRTFDVCEGEIS